MTEPVNDRVYLIDASIYIFAAYFSLPDSWHSHEGDSLNAVYGYSRFLLRFLASVKPSLVAVCFDESLGSCFRNELYPAYKSARAYPDEALSYQLALCRELTKLAGIICFASERFEADDLIASLSAKARAYHRSVTIVSRDKDLGQLLTSSGDRLWDFQADIHYCPEQFYQKFGVWPWQMVDYQTLLGDSIDGIPGVPRVGAKTAAQLLAQFASVEHLLSHLEQGGELAVRGAKSCAERILAHRAQLALSRQLVTLKTDLPLVSSLAALKLNWQGEALYALFGELNLKKALQKTFNACDKALASTPC
jgi:5'-3' exonuclease